MNNNDVLHINILDGSVYRNRSRRIAYKTVK